MTTVFKKAMLYLGLGSDEDFLGMDPIMQRESTEPDSSVNQPIKQPTTGVNVTTIPNDKESPLGKMQAVRKIPPPKARKPHVVTPVRFQEVKEISEAAKRNQPVIVNLQQADHEVAVRIIDFCSGLQMGIEGSFEKAGADVFLITPKDVEVSDDEKKRLAASAARNS
ncbi:MAG: cell division protein SepF [Acidimicrobiales bacterium]|jgi:FtsZ-interacting cell division protein YlmF|nr:cell division protein SepF [Acidimicrobiales bacterium]